MLNEKRDKTYVILALGVWFSLILGSLLSEFNFIDLGYLLIFIIYVVKFRKL